ncbi:MULTISPECIES: chorismate synthase [unclassified Streptomyces]|uniref:chorismate synthase n=1 Tax=unclassified Streptomyces TaxID=2593676 RepID=UPI0020355E86|nr:MULTISPECIES: chorismate synthase [unclassified Streptomyces]
MTPMTISAAGSGAAAGTPDVGAGVGDTARIAWAGTAGAAARTAGVTVRTVQDVAGIHAVADFFADVWQMPRATPPYPSEVLHSMVHAGGAVHAAYCAGPSGERLAGAAVAVFGPPAERDVYSFVAAATAAGRGVGFAVKQAQRLWALERGATTMRWTFDPLVSRNARFNLVKLGAIGSEYLVDFYGPMNDGVNNGDESDRLTVVWDLVRGTTRTGDPAEGRSAADVVRRAPDGGPLALRDKDRLWCRVPEDIVALRAADPALALGWRRAVREVLTEAYAEGLRASAMSRDGWYLLTRPSCGHPTGESSAGGTDETSCEATDETTSEITDRTSSETFSEVSSEATSKVASVSASEEHR